MKIAKILQNLLKDKNNQIIHFLLNELWEFVGFVWGICHKTKKPLSLKKTMAFLHQRMKWISVLLQLLSHCIV
jgi:hypothetical protein